MLRGPPIAYRTSSLRPGCRFFSGAAFPIASCWSDLAIAGKLRDPRTLELQTRRMLADPRARSALVTNFFGQWLQVRNVWLLTPDANPPFPWFDDNLRAGFVKETELFLESQLQDDRSVLELLTADYTFVNEQLARHYGIRGVYGSHFRRVKRAIRIAGVFSAKRAFSPSRRIPIARRQRSAASGCSNIFCRAGAAASSKCRYDTRRGDVRQTHVGP